MKSWPRLVPVGALLALVPLAHARPGDDPFRTLSFDAACAAAKSESKVVLIDFFTTWCGPCKKLDEVTWKDESVRTWLAAKTIPLRLDAEKETALAERFQIDAYPSLVFVQPDGKELGRLVGFREPEKFIAEANSVIGGIHPSDRLKKELDEKGWDDPMKRQSYADELVQERRYPEALEQYLWCFDHGLEHDMSYTGVRLSFLLSRIAELGRKHPQALTELRTRRDSARQALLDGVADFYKAAEFAALNRELEEARNTLEVYDALAKVEFKTVKGVRTNPRASLFREVMDLLIEDRRYADALSGVGDPLKYLAGELGQFKQSLAFMDDESRKSYEEFGRRNVVQNSSRIYEGLLGAKHDDEAAAYLAKVLEFDASDSTRKTLAEHARHAGNTTIAESIEHPAAKAAAK